MCYHIIEGCCPYLFSHWSSFLPLFYTVSGHLVGMGPQPEGDWVCFELEQHLLSLGNTLPSYTSACVWESTIALQNHLWDHHCLWWLQFPRVGRQDCIDPCTQPVCQGWRWLFPSSPTPNWPQIHCGIYPQCQHKVSTYGSLGCISPSITSLALQVAPISLAPPPHPPKQKHNPWWFKSQLSSPTNSWPTDFYVVEVASGLDFIEKNLSEGSQIPLMLSKRSTMVRKWNVWH